MRVVRVCESTAEVQTHTSTKFVTWLYLRMYVGSPLSRDCVGGSYGQSGSAQAARTNWRRAGRAQGSRGGRPERHVARRATPARIRLARHVPHAPTSRPKSTPSPMCASVAHSTLRRARETKGVLLFAVHCIRNVPGANPHAVHRTLVCAWSVALSPAPIVGRRRACVRVLPGRVRRHLVPPPSHLQQSLLCVCAKVV